MYRTQIPWRWCAILSIMVILTACGTRETGTAVQPTAAVPTAIPATSPPAPSAIPTAVVEPTADAPATVAPTLEIPPTPEPPDPAAWAAELDKHRKLWENSKIAAYAYEQQMICFCLPEVTQPFSITVKNDTVTGIGVETGTKLETLEMKRPVKIEDFFTLIEEAIKQPAGNLQVDYEPTLGYPTKMYIDYMLEVADDELSYEISKFKVIEKGQ